MSAAAAVTALTVTAIGVAVVLVGCQGAVTTSSAANRPAAGSGSGRQSGTASSPRPTRRCVTADLRVAPAAHTEKQGLDVERFAVTTAAADGCLLAGAPNLRPKGPLAPQAPGATVDLAVSQLPVPDTVDLQTGTGDSAGTGDGAAVALLPGRPASFYLAWYSSSPVVCVQSSGFAFNAPGDPSYADMKSVDYAIGPVCDGIFYVSPVF